jgi:hypothetical protein
MGDGGYWVSMGTGSQEQRNKRAIKEFFYLVDNFREIFMNFQQSRTVLCVMVSAV